MFDESQVRAILQRAIELDSVRSGTLTREELLQAGGEAGVSREALEQAMSEQTPTVPTASQHAIQPVRLSFLRLLNIGTAIGITGGLLTSNAWHVGFRSAPLPMSVVGTLCFGGLIMLSGGLALSDSTKTVRRYFEENTGVWLGFGFGGVLAGGIIGRFGPAVASAQWIIDSALANSILGLFVTSVVGATLLVMRRASAVSEGASDGSTPRGPAAPPSSSLLKRAAAGVRKLVTAWDDRRTKRSSTASSADQRHEASAF